MKTLTKLLAVFMAVITVFSVSSVAIAATPQTVAINIDMDESGAWGNYETGLVETVFLGIYSDYAYFTQFGTSYTVVNVLKKDVDGSWITIDSFTQNDTRLSITPAANAQDAARIYLNMDYSFEPESEYSFEFCANALRSDNGLENKVFSVDMTGKRIIGLLPHTVTTKETVLIWLEDNHPDWGIAFWLVENFDIFVTIYNFIKGLFPS